MNVFLGFLYKAQKIEIPVRHVITVVGLIKFLVKRFVSPCTVTEPKKIDRSKWFILEQTYTEDNIELLTTIRVDVITRNK